MLYIYQQSHGLICSSRAELGNHGTIDETAAFLPTAEFEEKFVHCHSYISGMTEKTDIARGQGPRRWFRPGGGYWNARMLQVAARHGNALISGVATPPPSVAPVVSATPVVQSSAAANAEVVMEKLSVTLPHEMHEQLLDMSRARRRAKKPYQLSQIVREAMGAWFAANAPRG